jgi:NitT/TauT family transport system substrate-binding protein
MRAVGVVGVAALVMGATAATTSGSAPTTAPAPADSTALTAPDSTVVPAGDPLAPSPLADRTVVKVGMVSYVEAFAGLLVGEILGEFDKENIEIEYVQLPPADVLLQVMQGELDVSPNAFSAGFLNAILQGAEVKFIAPVNWSAGESLNGVFLRPEFAENPELLRGQRILMNSGRVSSNVLTVGQYLESVGLSINDVVIDSAPPDEMVAALESGEAAGAYLTSPRYLDIVERGVAVSAFPEPPGYVMAGIVAGPSITDQPDVLQAFVRAYARTFRDHLQGDYHADEEVVAALATSLGVEPDVVRSAPNYVFDPELRMLEEPFLELQRFFRELGSLEVDEPIPFDTAFDTSYLERLGLNDQ